MPDLSASASALRANNRTLAGWLAVHPGTLVCTADITATPANPTTTLAISVTAGAIASVNRLYRVVIETGVGVFKGETRVRASGTLDATNLPIRELSKGEINVSSGDVAKIYSIVPLSDRLPEATELFNPDGEAYAAQGSDPPPVTCSGGHHAAHVDSGQTFATITTKGDNSYVSDPDSAAITHLWTLPTGVAFQAGSLNTDANPTLEVNVGNYTVQHRVTDSTNSKTMTQYIQYAVYDSSTTPVEVAIESLQGDVENGWSATLQAFGSSLTLSTIPDGSLVTLFVYEIINDTAQSFGNVFSGRNTAKLTGYLMRDRNSGDADNTELRFEVISPLTRLSMLPGYSKVMLREQSPDAWNEIKTLTAKRAIIRLIMYYTTLIEAGFDLIFDITDYNYAAFYLQKNTPKEQVKELADAIDARLICDRAGRFEVHTHPDLIPLADRSSVTTTLTLTDDDILTFDFAREHFRKVELVEVRGLSAATTTAASLPYFSRWPGTPGLGAQSAVIERKIIASSSSQTDINNRAGRIGAQLDGVYADSDGKLYPAIELSLTLRGVYDVADFYKEYFAVSLGTSTNLRGVDLSVYKFWVKSVSVSQVDTDTEVTLTLQAASNAAEGTTYVPSAETEAPTTPPVDIPSPVGTGNTGLGRLTNTLALFNSTTNSELVIYSNFQGSPSAAVVDLTALGLAGTPLDFFVHADSPLYLGTGNKVNGMIATTTDIFEITDIFNADSARAVASVHTFSGTSSQRTFNAERNDPTFVVCVSYYGASGTIANVSTDGGATFGADVVVNNATAATGYTNRPGLAIPAHLTTTAYVGTLAATAYKTTNGSSWSTLTNPDVSPAYMPATIVVPYTVRDGSVVYHGDNDGTDQLLVRVVNTTVTNISYTTGGRYWGIDLQAPGRGFAVCDTNENIGVLCGCKQITGSMGSAGDRGVFVSYDLRATAPTWTVLVTPASGVYWWQVYVTAPDCAYVTGTGAQIGVWLGGGAIIEKTVSTTAAGVTIGICGG